MNGKLFLSFGVSCYMATKGKIMEKIYFKIGDTCYLTRADYEGDADPCITLEYTERQADPYYSDTETSLDIDKEKTVEIINMLKEAFDT